MKVPRIQSGADGTGDLSRASGAYQGMGQLE
jgi:hypothetical protein